MANNLRQIRPAIQNPFPLPAEYLFPDAINADAKKAYSNMSPADKIINGGKLWSMYDLMKYYHSGFMPTNNDANYIEYEIDFTHNDISGEAKGDPLMVNQVKTKLLESFQPLSSAVETQYAKNKTDIVTQQSGILATSLTQQRRGGGLDGNMQYDQMQPQQQQMQMQMQPQQQQMQMQPQQQQMQMQPQQQQMQQLAPDMFNGGPQSILSPEYLTDRCLTSIGGITFNSLNRIFVTRTFASLPLVESMDGKPIHLTLAETVKQFPVDESQTGGIHHKKDGYHARSRRHRSRKAKRAERAERAEREREREN